MRQIRLLVALLLPLAIAQPVLAMEGAVTVGAATPQHTLQAGDIGTATIHASGTGASVALSSFPILGSDDILKIASTNASWQVHAELVSQSGWTSLLESVTVSLWDGAQTQTQIQISQLSGVTQSSGADVNLPTGTPAEVRVEGLGTGSVTLDLVLTVDGTTNPKLLYRVSLVVG